MNFLGCDPRLYATDIFLIPELEMCCNIDYLVDQNKKNMDLLDFCLLSLKKCLECP